MLSASYQQDPYPRQFFRPSHESQLHQNHRHRIRSNFFAQPEAFAFGKTETEVRKELGSCAGDQSTTSAEDPRTLGALFKFTQGVIRGISHFVIISAQSVVSRSLDVVMVQGEHHIGLEPAAVRRCLVHFSWEMSSEIRHCQCDSLQRFEIHDEKGNIDSTTVRYYDKQDASVDLGFNHNLYFYYDKLSTLWQKLQINIMMNKTAGKIYVT